MAMLAASSDLPAPPFPPPTAMIRRADRFGSKGRSTEVSPSIALRLPPRCDALKNYDGRAPTTPPLGSEPIFADRRVRIEHRMHDRPQRASAFAVDDAHLGEAFVDGEIEIIGHQPLHIARMEGVEIQAVGDLYDVHADPSIVRATMSDAA